MRIRFQILPPWIYCCFSIVDYLLFIIYCSLSTVHCLLFIVYCSLSTVHCQLFIVHFYCVSFIFLEMRPSYPFGVTRSHLYARRKPIANLRLSIGGERSLSCASIQSRFCLSAINHSLSGIYCISTVDSDSQNAPNVPIQCLIVEQTS